MKILFCNIAQMKYYKGIISGNDEPQYGGDFVLQTGDAHEKYNFDPVTLDGDEVCLGFFETKSTNGSDRNQLHIEKLEGVQRIDTQVDDVLVIWCAKRYDASSVVVGISTQHYTVIIRNVPLMVGTSNPSMSLRKPRTVSSSPPLNGRINGGHLAAGKHAPSALDRPMYGLRKKNLPSHILRS